MDMFACMRNFLAVVDCKSFTIAANKLHISVSKLSKQMNSLEHHFKTPLFRRSKYVSLTEAGTILKGRAQYLLNQLGDLEDEVLNKKEELRGNLKIITLALIGDQDIAEAAFKFTEKYPKVTIELLTGSYSHNLAHENFDLGLYFGYNPDPRVQNVKLYDVQRTIYGSPKYFKKHGMPKTIKALHKHNCLIYEPDPRRNIWILGSDTHVDISGNFSSNNRRVLLDAAVNGTGLLIASEKQAAELVTQGLLQPVAIKEARHKIPLYAYYKDEHDTRVRVFIEFLKQQAESTK